MTIGTRQVGIGLALAAAVGFGAAAGAAEKVAAGAHATLNPTQGSTVKGKVEFKPAKGGVLVTAHIEGLTPGTHGFHVHEKGDCSAPDGTSAGGHFNPATQPHAAACSSCNSVSRNSFAMISALMVLRRLPSHMAIAWSQACS